MTARPRSPQHTCPSASARHPGVALAQASASAALRVSCRRRWPLGAARASGVRRQPMHVHLSCRHARQECCLWGSSTASARPLWRPAAGPEASAVPRRGGRVGSGLSDRALQTITDQLKPYLAYTCDAGTRVPANYRVVKSPKVTPDAWVRDPSKSIVLKARPGLRGAAWAAARLSGVARPPAGMG